MKSAWFVVLLMLATGAAAKEKDSDSDAASSLALKIARAAHLDQLRDATVVQTADANVRSDGKSDGSSLAMGAIGAGQAAKVFRAPRGFSQGGAAATSMALGFLTSLPKAVPENSPRLLVFLPTTSADSPQQASEVARGKLQKALEQTVPEANVRFVEKQKRVQAHFAMDLPGCTDCRITWLGLQEFVRPKVEKTPAFMGEGESYTWGHPNKQGDGLLTGFPWSHASMPKEERQDFLLRLSANLPREMYIYLPPDPNVTDAPVILHQGDVLPFERPGVSPAATAQTEPSGGAAGSGN